MLIHNVFEIAQYFVSQYNFSMVNDQDDQDSPLTQSLVPMSLFAVCCNKHLLIYEIILISLYTLRSGVLGT
jgi:hypothetical protein